MGKVLEQIRGDELRPLSVSIENHFRDCMFCSPGHALRTVTRYVSITGDDLSTYAVLTCQTLNLCRCESSSVV